MAKSSRPRKPHKPKPVVLPLGMRNSASFELPGYVASPASASRISASSTFTIFYRMPT
jgi:hypothetical protein